MTAENILLVFLFLIILTVTVREVVLFYRWIRTFSPIRSQHHRPLLGRGHK